MLAMTISTLHTVLKILLKRLQHAPKYLGGDLKTFVLNFLLKILHEIGRITSILLFK